MSGMKRVREGLTGQDFQFLIIEMELLNLLNIASEIIERCHEALYSDSITTLIQWYIEEFVNI